MAPKEQQIPGDLQLLKLCLIFGPNHPASTYCWSSGFLCPRALQYLAAASLVLL